MDDARRRAWSGRTGRAVSGLLGFDRTVADHVKAYVQDLKDSFVHLGGVGLDLRKVTRGRRSWFRGVAADAAGGSRRKSRGPANRGPPLQRVECEPQACGFDVVYCSTPGTGCGWQVYWSALHPRSGRSSLTSNRPFLHHVTKSNPQRRRTIKLAAFSPRPQVLTAEHAQAILDACEHLRDRLLLALLLDTGVRMGRRSGRGTRIWPSPSDSSPSGRRSATTVLA